MKKLIYLLLLYFPAENLYSQEIDSLYGTRYNNEKNHEMLVEKLTPQLISFVIMDGYFGTDKAYMRYTGLYLPSNLSSKNLRSHLRRFAIFEPDCTIASDWKTFLQKEPHMMVRISGKTIVVIFYNRKRKFPNVLSVISYLEIYK